MAGRKKIALICIHGPEDPERAALPFALAMLAQAADVEAVIGCQARGRLLLSRGSAERVRAPGIAPLRQLIDAYVQDGGRLVICDPPLGALPLNREELVEGVEVLSRSAFLREFDGAANIAIYWRA